MIPRKRTPDTIGTRYERLVIIDEATPYVQPSTGVRQRQWLCRCDCGNEKVVAQAALRRGDVKSCGCLNEELKRERTKHGHAIGGQRTKTLVAWGQMIKRCTDSRVDQWPNYGGRGVTVCDRWSSFNNFLADMGECPPSLSLERNDVNGNYEPSNCRWATMKEQGRNKRNNRVVEFNGRKMAFSEACEIAGIDYHKAHQRLTKYGWPLERALAP